MTPMKHSFVAIFAMTVGSVLWSCSTDQTPTETRSTQEQLSRSAMPVAGGGMMDPLRADCPMAVQGAAVTVTDTEDGVALTFTTDTGDVADLRTRVQSMAQMYELHRGQAGMMWHHMDGEGMEHGGSGMGHMAGRGNMPAARTTMVETDMGAQLELRPRDASQLDALREHVRWHQQRMQSGECWMQQGHPTDTLRGEEE